MQRDFAQYLFSFCAQADGTMKQNREGEEDTCIKHAYYGECTEIWYCFVKWHDCINHTIRINRTPGWSIGGFTRGRSLVPRSAHWPFVKCTRRRFVWCWKHKSVFSASSSRFMSQSMLCYISIDHRCRVVWVTGKKKLYP